MQKHALQSLLLQRLVVRKVAISIVACDRKTEMREMHAYLVCAAGPELCLEQ